MIFVDTGAWFALKAPDDRFHDQAVTFHDELVTGRHGSLVVSDYIMYVYIRGSRYAGPEREKPSHGWKHDSSLTRNGKSGLVECHSSRPGETPKHVRGLPFNRAIKMIRYPNLMPVQTKRTIVSRMRISFF